MDDPHDLQGFVDAQDAGYARVCDERRHGHKRSHWMWFVFPQISSFYKIRRLPFIHQGAHPLPTLSEISARSAFVLVVDAIIERREIFAKLRVKA